ncbi:MAG: hypothetical protein ABSG84_07870 [Acidobacteriaceae bacterium]|jgi:hypothetical protein
MKTHMMMMMRLATIAAAIALIGCDNAVTISPAYIGVIISPRPSSIPVGGTMVFTGTVSNNLSLPQWSVLDSADANSVGTLTPVSGSSDTILYAAPPTPPIYSYTAGLTQGTVTLKATTTPPPGTSITVAGDSVTFVITAPLVTVALTPATATVNLGATQQFFGYAVGSTNNTLTWQLSANGLPSASGALGTINSAGTYIAPPFMPASGNTVTITIISQADPTKTQSAVVTLE